MLASQYLNGGFLGAADIMADSLQILEDLEESPDWNKEKYLPSLPLANSQMTYRLILKAHVLSARVTQDCIAGTCVDAGLRWGSGKTTHSTHSAPLLGDWQTGRQLHRCKGTIVGSGLQEETRVRPEESFLEWKVMAATLYRLARRCI